MQKGFIGIISLLLAVLFISLLVWGMANKDDTGKGQIENYNDAILDAENLKNTLESRSEF